LNYFWVQSSRGLKKQDTFEYNMKGIADAFSEDSVGLYHFLHPDDIDSCEDQAKFFLNLYNNPAVPTNAKWAIDLETTDDWPVWPEMADCLSTFLGVIGSQLTTPTIYTNPTQWNPNFNTSYCDLVQNSPLWASRYNLNTPPDPVNCWEGRTWDTWQFSSTVSWPNITINTVDLSCLNPDSKSFSTAEALVRNPGVINQSIFSPPAKNSKQSNLISPSNRSFT
jgi:GH25 family lysozyme M1 (1,4-beta-N-acetylmuramidase)